MSYALTTLCPALPYRIRSSSAATRPSSCGCSARALSGTGRARSMPCQQRTHTRPGVGGSSSVHMEAQGVNSVRRSAAATTAVTGRAEAAQSRSSTRLPGPLQRTVHVPDSVAAYRSSTGLRADGCMLLPAGHDRSACRRAPLSTWSSSRWGVSCCDEDEEEAVEAEAEEEASAAAAAAEARRAAALPAGGARDGGRQKAARADRSEPSCGWAAWKAGSVQNT